MISDHGLAERKGLRTRDSLHGKGVGDFCIVIPYACPFSERAVDF